jgi:uncharacterized RDD family membrane protein YckC
MAKTINITTTQNVTIEYELAALRERMMGFLIDLFIIGIGYLIIFRVLWAAIEVLLGEIDNGWGIFVALIVFVFFFAYNFLFEIINIGQTPGKMAMGIKVVRLDGKDPDWSDALLRSLLHLVDSLFSIGVIGSLLIKTTDKQQRFGDMAANTTVIRLRNRTTNFNLNDILSIASLDNYKPAYPQVRQLAESDMIFIKNVLTRYKAYPNVAHENVIEDLVTHLMPVLKINQRPADRVEFLKTLLRDYIVLTR